MGVDRGYSSQAQKVLLWTLGAILGGEMNPALERNTTSYGGRLALTGHILRNFAIVQGRPMEGPPFSLFQPAIEGWERHLSHWIGTEKLMTN